MRLFFIRCGVVIFWVSLILGALYFPRWDILPHRARSITVFCWGDILDTGLVEDFEKETGIKVYLNYYSSNEELLVKLKATKGRGYDLIIPSDYAVARLLKEDLLKPLDRTQIDFFARLNPKLLGHVYDPENRYSLPFSWEIFGLGINKDFFAQHRQTASWKMLFAPTPPYQVVMINDPIEAFQFGAFYLYGPLTALTAAQAQGVKQLLIQQKTHVEAYAEFRGDYFLATKNCPVVIASTSYIWRTMRQFPFVDFVIPEEGSFVSIENLSIPASSTKEKLVYQFMNYLYRPAVAEAHARTFGFYPATLEAPAPTYDFSRLHFIRELMPEQEMRDLWVEVKSSKEF